jgi:RND family efflux transporter MFP subunit
MNTSRFSFAARRATVCAAIGVAAACAWRVAVHAGDAKAAGATADAAPAPSVAVQTERVARETIAQPVRAYGIVAVTSSSAVTIDVPYTARIEQIRVQPGQAVKRGAPLVVVEADAASVLAAAQAKSAETLAEGELARTQSLFDKDLATQSQLAAAHKTLDDARETFAAQQRMGVAVGPRTIAAPADGVVSQISVAQGDQVQPGAGLMQLALAGRAGDARPNVLLGVEPADAAAIHAGDEVTLHGLSTALERTATSGRVTLVGAAVDAQSQLVNVGATVPLAQRTPFLPGTRVRADIATDAGTHWAVPRAAVLRDSGGAYLYQVTRDGHAKRVPVDVKIEAEDRYGVEGTLDAALPVVVVGNYELRDGMAVRAAGGATR